MDSILKFSGDSQEKYRQLFGKEFVDLFIDTFQKVYSFFNLPWQQYYSTCLDRRSDRFANKKDAMREDRVDLDRVGGTVVFQGRNLELRLCSCANTNENKMRFGT